MLAPSWRSGLAGSAAGGNKYAFWVHLSKSTKIIISRKQALFAQISFLFPRKNVASEYQNIKIQTIEHNPTNSLNINCDFDHVLSLDFLFLRHIDPIMPDPRSENYDCSMLHSVNNGYIVWIIYIYIYILV